MFSLSINGIAKTYRRSSPPACLYTSKIHQPAQAAKAPVCPAPFFMEQRCSVQRLFGAGYPAPFSLETFSLPEGRRVRRAFGASRYPPWVSHDGDSNTPWGYPATPRAVAFCPLPYAEPARLALSRTATRRVLPSPVRRPGASCPLPYGDPARLAPGRGQGASQGPPRCADRSGPGTVGP